MKRIIPVLLLVFVLAGCFPQQATRPSDDMATRVAGILTEMPTPVAVEPSATWTELPEVELTQAPTETPTASPAPTETQLPTATLAPTETATLEPTLSPTAEFVATIAATSVDTTQTGGGAPNTQTGGGAPTPPPTLTPGTGGTAQNDIRNKLGSPYKVDPMNDSSTWTWPVGKNKFTNIEFQNGMMRLTGLTKDSGWRLPLLDATSDVYVEMTVAPQDCSGADNYGIIFRVPVFREADRGYLFGLSCEGKYAVWKWDGQVEPDGKATMLIQWRASDKINTGSGAFNRMGVMAYGDRLLLYINGVKVDEVRDTSYVGGNLGVFVNPSDEQPFTIWVDEMSYWVHVNP